MSRSLCQSRSTLQELLKDAAALLEEVYVNPMPADELLHGVALEQHKAWAKTYCNRVETFLAIYHGL